MSASRLWAALGAAVMVAGCAYGPTMGRGPGAGPGPGPGMGPGMSDESMPGWAMMSEQEREAHRARMRSHMDPQECQRYMEEHRERMVQRARERGLNLPGPVPREACPMR